MVSDPICVGRTDTMSDSPFVDRVSRLIESRIAERRAQLPYEAAAITSAAAAHGSIRSGSHVLQLQRLYARELEVRAIVVWESIVRVHKTLGFRVLEGTSDEFKQMFSEHLSSIHSELAAHLAEAASRFGGGMKVDLSESHELVRRKHEVEIDLYFDSLGLSKPTGEPVATNYNFYGNVGAFQTGAQSVANVVQNLATAEREALDSAVQQVADALASATSLPERQRTELAEIAADCRLQLQNTTPNNTKLLTMFNVLATAVQGIASAQPAYLALKLALLPLGVTLP